jgi:hypothetical protein
VKGVNDGHASGRGNGPVRRVSPGAVVSDEPGTWCEALADNAVVGVDGTREGSRVRDDACNNFTRQPFYRQASRWGALGR